MLIPTKIQIDKKNYEFIKQVHKKLHYKSLSEYIRVAVNAKVEKDRLRRKAYYRSSVRRSARAVYPKIVR